MQKEAFEQLKKELAIIVCMFIAALLTFKLIFLSEDFFIVLRTVMAIFWLFVLPGFAVMFYWNKELKFYERLVIGIGIGTVLLGLMGYYTGLLGLHAMYHALVLPIAVLIVGISINAKKFTS